MKKLKDIIPEKSGWEITGNPEIEIAELHFDSRKVMPHSLFAAVRGTLTDGHQYVSKAVENGAVAIVCEEIPKGLDITGLCMLKVPSSSRALGEIADLFFDRPSQNVRLIGVTGTNGKTTVVALLHALFSQLGLKAGMLSTIENRIGQEIVPASHTTPDQVQIHRLLSEMVDAQCDYAFMEVSSHAAVQNRIAGLKFSGGIFTNISRDHLDYHKTMKAYINAKKKFFDELDSDAVALINIDDKNGEVMVQNSAARVVRYGLQNLADYHARILEQNLDGMQLRINGQDIYTVITGRYNAYNLLTVLAVASELEPELPGLLEALSQLKAPEGRFDRIRSDHRPIYGIIDYAHTPDALEKLLANIRTMMQKGRIITVVGCGGDRDKGKRPMMGQIATELSDWTILTSDNPRSEDPMEIIEEMKQGISSQGSKYLIQVSRREAIETAARMAEDHDVIVIAGKGHEKYQEILGKRNEFDDKSVLIEAWEKIYKK